MDLQIQGYRPTTPALLEGRREKNIEATLIRSHLDADQQHVVT
jgi:hypothetical protein